MAAATVVVAKEMANANQTVEAEAKTRQSTILKQQNGSKDDSRCVRVGAFAVVVVVVAARGGGGGGGGGSGGGGRGWKGGGGRRRRRDDGRIVGGGSTRGWGQRGGCIGRSGDRDDSGDHDPEDRDESDGAAGRRLLLRGASRRPCRYMSFKMHLNDDYIIVNSRILPYINHGDHSCRPRQEDIGG